MSSEKNILIVDDEAYLLEVIGKGIEASADEPYLIFTAENGKQAVDILETHAIDLVVTDIRMPEMDGFQLLAYLSHNFPGVPAIAMSAYVNQSVINARAEPLGALRFFEKPFDIGELGRAVKNGLDMKFESGNLEGFSIASFLQLIYLEQKSCFLEVFKGPKQGTILIIDGEIYDAVTGDLNGEAAALEIIRWNNVSIQFKSRPKGKVKKTVHTEIVRLIMDAQKDQEEIPPPSGGETIPAEKDAVNLEDEDLDLTQEGGGVDVSQISDAGVFPQQADSGDEESFPKAKNVIKEAQMDIQKLKSAVDNLKKDAGDGLISTDIFSMNDGQSIVGINPQPAACALFNQLTGYLSKALKGSGFPNLGKYYIVDMEDDKMVVLLPLGDYQWGIFVDSSQIQLGLLLNVLVPNAMKAFEEALQG